MGKLRDSPQELNIMCSHSWHFGAMSVNEFNSFLPDYYYYYSELYHKDAAANKIKAKKKKLTAHRFFFFLFSSFPLIFSPVKVLFLPYLPYFRA